MLLENKLSKRMFAIFSLYSMNIVIFSFIFGTTGKGFEIVLANILYIAIFLLLLTMYKNKLPLKVFIWYLLYGLYTLTWIPITIQGILDKNNKEWNHTKHTRQISIQELE
jgi:ABC-type bacteriocin/lantibiotic exporter with double-glycine peptidase domain